jgi:hypothetical protein
MTALAGAGLETGKVAIVSTSIEMPVPIERLSSSRENPEKPRFGNLGAATMVGFWERRRTAYDGRF